MSLRSECDMNSSFFGDMLQTIAERGRALLPGTRETHQVRSDNLAQLCEDLLSGRGEASGVALAREILMLYSGMTIGPRIAFFETLATRFGPDRAAELHLAAEPRRQELFRRLNLAPGGTVALVRMREHLLDALDHREDLAAVDADFVHLFSSWFNRGFLVLRRIDWSTPANVLEKIIKHEAVHKIRSWDDLRRRVDPPDRRCYAFFHPAMVDEPLIFVEVALSTQIPDAIAPILAVKRDELAPEKTTTAAFYSISNCQRGLAGVSFGHFLIKQVVEEISRDIPRLSTFVTLSPAPGFAAWLRREREKDDSKILPAEDREALNNLETEGWWQVPKTRERVEAALMRAAAYYFLHGKNKRGLPADPVARFHLGNGARLERINFLGDGSENGIRQAYGVMVNYLYSLDDIEQNHEAFAQHRTVVASNAVKRMVRAAPTELVPLKAG
jgi:malonyl-CoA decarboxylase